MSYSEPKYSFLVLDYQKPLETNLLLDSIRDLAKFPYKIIYLHNGKSKYAHTLLENGKVDQLIETKENNGLGIGTRDLFAACFSEYAIYVQNDQILGREMLAEELDFVVGHIDVEAMLNHSDIDPHRFKSISLAGAPCGPHTYSERAHIIKTSFYKEMEVKLPLSFGGAGPYHSFEWREGQIQKFYKENRYLHWTYPNPFFIDNGVFAIRSNPDKSIWCHRTDTKKLWNITKPTEKYSAYPKLTDAEWQIALDGKWQDGTIPENERNDSFVCWNNTSIGKYEEEYIKNLRERYGR